RRRARAPGRRPVALRPTGPGSREAGPDLPPQERADLIANQAIEDASGLLRLETLGVDLARMLDGLKDGVFGDLVELNPMDRLVPEPHRLHEMPGDGLALTVGVARQVHGVGVFGLVLQPLDDVFL